MKLAHIMPVNASEKRKASVYNTLKKAVSPSTQIDIIDYPNGPKNLEYYEDDIKAVQLMLKDKERLSKYDGVNIACFYDPGYRELKEVLKIPVTGIGHASMSLANCLGHKTSVIVGKNKWIPKMSDNSLLYGFSKNITSWRSVDLNVEELKMETEDVSKRILKEVEKAINYDLAEVIILGCAALDKIEEEIKRTYEIPVINPIVAGITQLEMLANLNMKYSLTHSKLYDFQAKDSV